MRKLPREPWTILEWGNPTYTTESGNQILAITNWSMGNFYTKYEPSKMCEGKIGFFGIAYKLGTEAPVTPRLIQYDQPIGSTILSTEPTHRASNGKIYFRWQVTSGEPLYDSATTGDGNPTENNLWILIPKDETHSDTIFKGRWLRNFAKRDDLETIIIGE